MNDGIPFLFAANLDATLLPNTGKLPELGCLERTQALLFELRGAARPVRYCADGSLHSARLAAGVFRLPLPSWWVCRRGAEIHDRDGRPDADWQARLGPALDRWPLCQSLADIPSLSLREAPRQGSHKLGYYYPSAIAKDLRQRVEARMNQIRDGLRVLTGFGPSTGRGLLDIIPAMAGKAAALRHVAECCGFSEERVFFASDSEGDFDALSSGLCGTLVGNASAKARAEALRRVAERRNSHLHMAEAYCGDGVIEGLRHHGLWSG
jgi:hypothetical protein